MSDGEVGKLQDAAKDRKARLLALRAQVKGEKRPHSEVEEEGAIKLRNYKPQNEDMAVGEPAAPEQPKLALVEQDKVDEVRRIPFFLWWLNSVGALCRHRRHHKTGAKKTDMGLEARPRKKDTKTRKENTTCNC
eukprot:comp21063_c0_seq1/m.28348 comp21063_c0_seq1/g.28348  ORF comp21063_c0_seq1/g.28348 comp21063_c0_seq1/m.28348 type:complete len:134 (-) comp21063_c0_seq1:550-951(-)